MSYDDVLERLEAWVRAIEAERANLAGVVAGMRETAADLARESELPAEFRTWGPGDPKTRAESINEAIASLRDRPSPEVSS